MDVQTIDAAEVLQIAQDFRARALEAGDTLYRHLMLRTAIELEERAAILAEQDGTDQVHREHAAA